MQNPDSLYELDDEQAARSIAEVRAAFGKDRKKIFIIGAGVSASAGCMVFESPNIMKLYHTNNAPVETFDQKNGHIRSNGGKFSLNSDALRTSVGVESNLKVLRALVDQTKRAVPTEFHHMLNDLAARGDDIRVYTQNIDDLENRLPYLSSNLQVAQGHTNITSRYANVIQMHGTISQVGCIKCQEVTAMDLSIFNNGFPDCPFCRQKHLQAPLQRTRDHHPRLEARHVGVLRPHVLLYGDAHDTWSALDFANVLEHDLFEQPPDTVVVAGTNLRIPSQQTIAKQFCKAAHEHSSHSTTIWLNTTHMTAQLRRAEIFDYAMQGTADEFALFVRSNLNTEIPGSSAFGDL